MKLFMRHTLSIFWFPIYRFLNQLVGPHSPEAFRILSIHHVPKPQRALFERLLRYVIDVHGIITPEEAEARLKGEILPGSRSIPYLLTFDDGFKSQVTLSREILDRYAVKAIFFICPGLMDISPDSQREAVAKHTFNPQLAVTDITDDMLLMSWSDTELLIHAGHTIGVHTMSHRRLLSLSEQDLTKEIIAPADTIKSRLGMQVKWFAYPFGDHRSIDSQSLLTIGRQYQYCCSNLRGVNSSKTYPLELFREGIDLQAPFHYQKMVLAGGLDFFYRKKGCELAKMANIQEISKGINGSN